MCDFCVFVFLILERVYGCRLRRDLDGPEWLYVLSNLAIDCIFSD